MFPDEVYVFTPKGSILELPKGATAVDFAYAVHTDVGNRCIACRIDRTLAPLSRPLNSGETVEILTAPNARPNSDWLSFVTTGKARAAIRHTLKQREQSESIKLGERILTRALLPYDIELDQLTAEQTQDLIEHHKVDTFEQVLAQIGLGDIPALSVVGRLTGDDETGSSDSSKPLAIAGSEGVMVTYGRCCMPVPGTPSWANQSRQGHRRAPRTVPYRGRASQQP